MPKAHHPRRGSMQFWPRRRSRHSLARIRSWAEENKAKPLGFIAYKAGMTHVLADDNRKNSLTKGDKISFPVTIIDCPPMTVMGISFYKNSLKINSFMAEKLNKIAAKKIQLPKKQTKKEVNDADFDDLRLIVHSNPKQAQIGTKKPKLLEIAIGGNKEEKVNYAKEVLGKEIKINEVFEAGNLLDVHGITIGKGFQGTVKRYGVPIRQKKSEKVKRGIGNLGAWTPKRVLFNVAQPGKMGYHLRTEYNKQIIKIGEDGSEITPKRGFGRYGLVKNNYLLLKGSIVGPKKRAIVLVKGIRPTKKVNKEVPEITYVSIK